MLAGNLKVPKHGIHTPGKSGMDEVVASGFNNTSSKMSLRAEFIVNHHTYMIYV